MGVAVCSVVGNRAGAGVVGAITLVAASQPGETGEAEEAGQAPPQGSKPRVRRFWETLTGDVSFMRYCCHRRRGIVVPQHNRET